MKIVCGANLKEDDVEAIMNASKTTEDVITENFLNDIDNLETNIKNSYVDVLAWMVKNDLLEIKVAIKLDENGKPTFGKDGGLHSKIGIFKDCVGNYITINGSNNETPYGWGKNSENFDVFFGWEVHDLKKLQRHINKFNKFWNDNAENYDVMDIPKAVKRHLISRSVSNIGDVQFIEDIISDGEGTKQPKIKIPLYDYQKTAREKWFDNGKRGIFAMATGTGKTYTALGCVDKLLKEEEKLVTIISAPQMHLVQQWRQSVISYGLFDEFDEVIVVDSSNSNGKTQFKNAVYKVDMNRLSHILILTTHKSFSSDDFYDFIINDDFNCSFLFIGDEMHGLGSHTRRMGLIPQYNYRLGLSATPQRHFDDIGTDYLFDYFGGEVYSFSLERALEEINPATDLTYLTPYCYYPYFLELTIDELFKFRSLSNQIRNESNKDEPDYKKIENLMFRRANILKEADNKYDLLRNILNDMEDKSNLLVYCNENQIDEVVNILGNEFDLKVTTFTSKNDISERELILGNFANGNYDGLVAMHCLDEGVDVPSASRAILMCNSTNPREFIQRVGRIIRRDKNKSKAEIYDMIIKPSKTNQEFYQIEQNIFDKELDRSEYIGDLAYNNIDYHTKIFQIR